MAHFKKKVNSVPWQNDRTGLRKDILIFENLVFALSSIRVPSFHTHQMGRFIRNPIELLMKDLAMIKYFSKKYSTVNDSNHINFLKFIVFMTKLLTQQMFQICVLISFSLHRVRRCVIFTTVSNMFRWCLVSTLCRTNENSYVIYHTSHQRTNVVLPFLRLVQSLDRTPTRFRQGQKYLWPRRHSPY